MKKHTILLDCDGPLASFLGSFIKALNRLTGAQHRTSDVKAWDILKSLGYEGEEHREIISSMSEIVRSERFCASIEPQPWAKSLYSRLAELGDVVILTTPYAGSPHWMAERTAWLQDHLGVEERNVIFARRKELVMGCVLIDDKMDHVASWGASFQGGLPVLFPLPSNASEEAPVHPALGHDYIYPASNVDDVVSTVRMFLQEVDNPPF